MDMIRLTDSLLGIYRSEALGATAVFTDHLCFAKTLRCLCFSFRGRRRVYVRS